MRQYPRSFFAARHLLWTALADALTCGVAGAVIGDVTGWASGLRIFRLGFLCPVGALDFGFWAGVFFAEL
jgi:hypothetical protein